MAHSAKNDEDDAKWGCHIWHICPQLSSFKKFHGIEEPKSKAFYVERIGLLKNLIISITCWKDVFGFKYPIGVRGFDSIFHQKNHLNQTYKTCGLVWFWLVRLNENRIKPNHYSVGWFDFVIFIKILFYLLN